MFVASFPGPLLERLLCMTFDPYGKGHTSTLHAEESLGMRLHAWTDEEREESMKEGGGE